MRKIGYPRRRTLTNLAAAAISPGNLLATIAIMQQAAKQKSTSQYEDVRRVLNNIQRSQNALIKNINNNKKAPANFQAPTAEPRKLPFPPTATSLPIIM